MLLKILSWNIQWGRGADGKINLARTLATIALHNPDIICLQEIACYHPLLPGGGVHNNQAIQIAEFFPSYQSVYGVGSDLNGPNGKRSTFGNLILSRLPITQVFRYLLPWPVDPNVLSMQRMALEVVVDIPDYERKPLRIITTHLEYYSVVQRSAQVQALLEICANGFQHATHPRSITEKDTPFAAQSRGEAVVLCGDFNFTQHALEYQAIQSIILPNTPRLLDAWQVMHGSSANEPTVGVHGCGSAGKPYCCDFFFISENIARQVVLSEVDSATTASDHQPCILQLETVPKDL